MVDEDVPRVLSGAAGKRAGEWLDGVVRLAGTLVDFGLGDVQMPIEYELYQEQGSGPFEDEFGALDLVICDDVQAMPDFPVINSFR